MLKKMLSGRFTLSVSKTIHFEQSPAMMRWLFLIVYTMSSVHHTNCSAALRSPSRHSNSVLSVIQWLFHPSALFSCHLLYPPHLLLHLHDLYYTHWDFQMYSYTIQWTG